MQEHIYQLFCDVVSLVRFLLLILYFIDTSKIWTVQDAKEKVTGGADLIESSLSLFSPVTN
jgi:hypothetical protein